MSILKNELNLYKFDFVIICAGVGMKKCAQEPEESERINVINTIRLIDNCALNNCFIIFLSSIKVFNGKVPYYDIDSKTTLDSNYGRYKLSVENHIRKNFNSSACVLRLTKVITNKPDFIEMWNKECSEGKEITVYKNHFLSPLPANLVIKTILLLVKKKMPRLYHLGVDEEISYHNYAKKVFFKNEKALSLLKPVTDSSPIYNSLITDLPLN